MPDESYLRIWEFAGVKKAKERFRFQPENQITKRESSFMRSSGCMSVLRIFSDPYRVF